MDSTSTPTTTTSNPTTTTSASTTTTAASTTSSASTPTAIATSSASTPTPSTTTTPSTPTSKLAKKLTKKPTIAIRVLKAPVKVICKIRDLYISSMYTCAAGMGGPTNVYTSGLPKSYSTTSSRTDDDFAELMRIASSRSAGSRLDPEFLRRQQTAVPPLVPRSQSVAIGRIDEDETCDFGDDFRLKSEMFPRSRSHAVVSRIHA